MTAARVWILYEPTIYADLLECLFERLKAVKVTKQIIPDIAGMSSKVLDSEWVDVIVLPLNAEGQPRIDMLEEPFPDAKVLAFAPDGIRGLRRMPGESRWEELRPFGLSDLMFEVLKSP